LTMLGQRVNLMLRRIGVLLHFDAEYLFGSMFHLSYATFISMVMGLALSVIFARVMGEWAYGQYGLLLSIIGVLSVFTLSGMDSAMNRAVARGYGGAYTKGMWEKLRFSILGILGCLIASAYFRFLKPDTKLALSLLAAGLLFIPMNVLSSYQALLLGRRMFKQSSLWSALTISLTAATTILAIALTRSFLVVMLTYFGVSALVNTFFFLITLKERPNDIGDEAVLSYGKHLTLMEVVGIVYGYLDNLLIAYFLTLPDLAVYLVAMSLPPQIKALFKMLGIVMFPKLSALSQEEAYLKVKRRFPLLLLTGLVIGVIVAVLTPYFIILIYSSKYAVSVPYAQILIIGMSLSAPGIILGELLKSQERTRELYICSTGLPIFTAAVWVLAVTQFGLMGFVIARALSWLLSMLVSLWFVVAGPTPVIGESQAAVNDIEPASPRPPVQW
jgi:O-antigen/teichoic acid export membrane protein